ncbi:MAG: hypothetical protein JWQ71_350 [Pedosphaera sp.]|nr:hypothetical protein [Pedosphaera sp.]
MLKFIFSVVLLLGFSLSIHAGNSKLVGTWKSNKAATVDYLKSHTKLTPQQLEKVGSVLGKMVIEFDAEKMTMKSGNWKFVSKYKIVEESKDGVTIEAEDPGTKKLTKTKFELDNSGFWTPDEKIPGYKERFDKIVKS